MTEATTKKRVVSGMRPTGKLHIGHYFGALQNWVRLQDAALPNGEKEYDCFYFIADWHALTSDYADTSAVAQNTIEIVTDYLAAGLDPERHKNCTIFLQSLVPEHAELHLLLSMVTPLSWLERVPTYKEQLDNIRDKDLHTYGFLGYPCLQTADIVIYSQEGAQLVVPVGEDQVSHVELSREIVHRFNSFYGLEIDEMLRDPSRAWVLGEMQAPLRTAPLHPGTHKFPLNDTDWNETRTKIRARVLEIGFDNAIAALKEISSGAEYIKRKRILCEPEVMLTKTPRIPGLDGRKMSKSYGNAITLSESDSDIRAKTKVMVTDPARKRRTDRGNPDVCPVYDWHKLFSSPETLAWSAEGCRTAGIGCIECKAKMADHLIQWIAPIRERRVEYEQHPARVLDVIDQGSKEARAVAQETMTRVREAVFGWNKTRAEVKNL